jgi:hypothetical protein
MQDVIEQMSDLVILEHDRPSASINFPIAPAGASTLSFFGADGTEITLRMENGRIEIDTHGATMDKAAMAFWEAVRANYSNL